MPRQLQNALAVGAGTLAAFLALAVIVAATQFFVPLVVYINLLQIGAMVAPGGNIPGIAAAAITLALAAFVISAVTLVVVRRKPEAAAKDGWPSVGMRTGGGCGVGLSLPFLLYLGKGNAGFGLVLVGTGFWILAGIAAGYAAGFVMREALGRLDPDFEWRG
jgi:hypothetical protein